MLRESNFSLGRVNALILHVRSLFTHMQPETVRSDAVWSGLVRFGPGFVSKKKQHEKKV